MPFKEEFEWLNSQRSTTSRGSSLSTTPDAFNAGSSRVNDVQVNHGASQVGTGILVAEGIGGSPMTNHIVERRRAKALQDILDGASLEVLNVVVN